MTPKQFATFIASDQMTLLHWEEVIKLWASNPDYFEELTCGIADRLFPDEQENNNNLDYLGSDCP